MLTTEEDRHSDVATANLQRHLCQPTGVFTDDLTMMKGLTVEKRGRRATIQPTRGVP